MLNGAIDSVLTCDQLRISDKAPGAAPSYVSVLSKRVELSADDAVAVHVPAAIDDVEDGT